MAKPYQAHLHSAADLKTTYAAVRAGFVALALEKNRRATPFVAQARSLKAAATKARSPMDLLQLRDIQSALITAAGVSDKATNHLQDTDKTEAIIGLIRNFLEPAGANFVEELVFRFLLTRGDTLGGSMRNVGGFMAQCKLTRCVISRLRLADREASWLHSGNATWAPLPREDAGIENQLRGLHWRNDGNDRTLIYNLTVPLVKNNVDLCLFNQPPSQMNKTIQSRAQNYIALGELKGGIDPAGADEHWKTARSALTRIRDGFRKHDANPKTFFIGAAIEARMAQEIWEMLQDDTLNNAANLTADEQMESISAWLCKL
jgi:hypothetical protein